MKPADFWLSNRLGCRPGGICICDWPLIPFGAMKTLQKLAVSLIVGSMFLGGCQAKLRGAFILNGQTFQPTSCRSGEVSSFQGVDLINADGAIIRVVQTPMNIPQVLYLQNENSPATPLGTCGTMSFRRTNTRINNVYNVEGSASLQCAGPMNLSGTVRFENCH